jgi:HEAT repeat protein
MSFVLDAENPAPDPDPENLDDAREELRASIPEAAETMRDLLDADDDAVRLRAAEAILDRAGLSKARAPKAHKAQKSVGGEESGRDFGEYD